MMIQINQVDGVLEMRKPYNRKTALSFDGLNFIKLILACIATTMLSILALPEEYSTISAFTFGAINGLMFPVFRVTPFKKYDYSEADVKNALKDLQKALEESKKSRDKSDK
jgi:hypothetical protein